MARRWKPKVHKAIRRVHMYSGLALVPWVLMYGVTAVLFNHSSWMSTTRVLEVDSSVLERGAIANLPSATAVADAVLDKLQQAGGDGPLELELVQGSPRWVGSFSTSAETAHERVRISLDPRGRGGRISASPKGAEPEEGPFANDELATLDFDFTPSEDAIEDQFRAVAAASGLDVTDFSRRRLPDVSFDLRDGDRVFTCDVGMDGDVEIEPASGGASLRRKLLRLHIQHGDPGYQGWRKAWAVLVDIMGFAMIGWGISGVLMWWTIKKTRRAGTWSIVAGCGVMAVMAVAVWHVAGLS